MPPMIAVLVAHFLSFQASARVPAHIAQTLERPEEKTGPIPSPLPSSGEHHSTVYAYVYGGPSASDRVDFDSVTHVAWHHFDMDSSGNIEDARNWTTHHAPFVSAAHAEGVKVHLTMMPSSLSTMKAVLLNPTARSNAVSQMASLVNDYGADGVNIDFELLEPDTKNELVSFTAEMAAVVDEVYVSTPTKDWTAHTTMTNWPLPPMDWSSWATTTTGKVQILDPSAF